MKTLLGLLVLVALSGCQSWLGRDNTKQTVQGVSVLHSSGAEQFSYIKQQGSVVRFCTETDTDVQSTSGGGLSIAAAGDSIGDESSSGAVTLGGRDPTVLITRELMFRACELALNTNLKPADAEKVYTGTLMALIKIISVHRGDGTTSVSVAPVVDSNILNKQGKPSAPPPAKSDKASDGFSGFSWDDYSDKSNTIDDDHP